MGVHNSGFLSIDENNRVILSPELAAQLGAAPGVQIPFRMDAEGLHLDRSVDALARIYIEPTSACNFDCRTCMRNAWDEPIGSMDEEVFSRIVESLEAFSPTPLIFFGGFGEPLSHPGIFEMIRQVKSLGAKVELITNASLLDGDCARELVDCGLDRLWVSIDGATAEGYADVRLGEALPLVVENLERLRQIRTQACSVMPHLGIAFVAMRRNIHELPAVIHLGRRLGADRFSVSNLLAHTPELVDEVLYSRSYYETDQPNSEWMPLIELPRMEINAKTGQPLVEALRGRGNLSVTGQSLTQGANTCPFIEKRSLSIRWDGAVSPCLALLHRHTNYLDRTRRTIHPYSFGNVRNQSLVDVWNAPEYHALRERLLAFDFSPCVFCNSCENAESNQEDCFGNVTPACGGCLWAQGFIRCP